MLDIPLYITILFIATTLLTLLFLYKSADNSLGVLIISLIWLLIQGAVGLSGFYLVTNGIPPRFALAVWPALILIITLFVIPSGKVFISKLNLKYLTILHSVRIPVELVLFFLYKQKMIPQLMTFEGRNFDIVAGISSIFIWY